MSMPRSRSEVADLLRLSQRNTPSSRSNHHSYDFHTGETQATIFSLGLPTISACNPQSAALPRHHRFDSYLRHEPCITKILPPPSLVTLLPMELANVYHSLSVQPTSARLSGDPPASKDHHAREHSTPQPQEPHLPRAMTSSTCSRVPMARGSKQAS